MTVLDLLSRLRSLDVHVWCEGDRLRYRAPAGVLDDDLRAQLADQKGAVLAFLRGTAGPPVLDPPDRADLTALAPAAAAFRSAVHAVGLRPLLAALRHSGLRSDQLTTFGGGSSELATAVDLCCLGRPVPVAAARALVTGELLDHLTTLGLAEFGDGTARLLGLRLVEHFGRLLFVGPPEDSRTGYYGPDSVGLGRLLLGAEGSCLDLFAGTGAQTVLLAGGATSVVSVELDAGLAPVLTLNLLLNGHQDKVEDRWGDVRTVDLPADCDVVCANAPMSPDFGLPALGWRADGGPDGSKVLAPSLRRVRLAPTGRLFALCMAAGTGAGPDVGWVGPLAADQGWSVTVLPVGSTPLGRDTVALRRLSGVLAGQTPLSRPEAGEELLGAWDALGVDTMYTCLLAAGPAGRPGLRVVSPASGGNGWWL